VARRAFVVPVVVIAVRFGSGVTAGPLVTTGGVPPHADTIRIGMAGFERFLFGLSNDYATGPPAG
jgi:hypothetical protein